MIAATRPHIAAVTALLESLSVYVSEAPGSASPPWVVIQPSPGVPMTETLGDPSADLEMPFMTKCVGATADQAMWLSDRVASLLDRAVPVIAGRACWPIWCDTSQPVQKDDTTSDTYFYAVARWRLHSTPE